VSASGDELTADIVESCRRGDRDAFRVLYEAHKDKVYSLALYFFHGDTATASDVTQQVFLKLMTTISQYRGDSGFSTWLHRLVVNTCIDGTRRRQSKERPLPDDLASPQSLEVETQQAESSATILRAVSALPPEFRLPVLMRYFEGLSYEEISGAMNCSMGTVASRLSRGHKLLAEALAHLKGGRR
jgi:RNA polymerase sigma-70 factor (ECF subfamily)